jgi:hypothetical protein
MKVLKLNEDGLKELEEWIREEIINVKVENNNREGIKWLRLKIDEVWEEEVCKINEKRENLGRENNEDLEQSSNKKNKKRKYNSENKDEENKKRNKVRRKSKITIKSDNEIEDGYKEDKVELLIKELEIPSRIKIVINMEDEKNDIEKLVMQYEKLEIGNRLLLKDWYDYGRNFYQNIEDRKRGNNEREKKRKSEKEIRTELYNKMMEYQRDVLNEDNEVNEKNRENLKKRIQKAINVYKLFMEIGNEKLERLREISVTFVVKLKEEQRKRIIKYFKKK